MKLYGFIFALLAALTLAQDQQNYINVPQGGFNIVAGQPFTITWSNPSSGTVTISLTQGNLVEPGDGLVLTTVPASAGSATFNIPTNVNNGQYNFQIVDDTNTENVNFSSSFQISGATDVVNTSTVSNTSSGASTSTASSSSASNSSSSSASATSSSATRSSTASRTSASETAAATTTAPSNGAPLVQAGGFLAIMAGAIAVF